MAIYCLRGYDDMPVCIRSEDLAELLNTILLSYEGEDSVEGFIDYINYGEEDEDE